MPNRREPPPPPPPSAVESTALIERPDFGDDDAQTPTPGGFSDDDDEFTAKVRVGPRTEPPASVDDSVDDRVDDDDVLSALPSLSEIGVPVRRGQVDDLAHLEAIDSEVHDLDATGRFQLTLDGDSLPSAHVSEIHDVDDLAVVDDFGLDDLPDLDDDSRAPTAIMRIPPEMLAHAHAPAPRNDGARLRDIDDFDQSEFAGSTASELDRPVEFKRWSAGPLLAAPPTSGETLSGATLPSAPVTSTPPRHDHAIVGAPPPGVEVGSVGVGISASLDVSDPNRRAAGQAVTQVAVPLPPAPRRDSEPPAPVAAHGSPAPAPVHLRGAPGAALVLVDEAEAAIRHAHNASDAPTARHHMQRALSLLDRLREQLDPD